MQKGTHNVITVPLDPEILSTPFKVQTKWVVLTGTSCCGKTTMVNQLADKGYQTMPEVARGYFDKEIAKGRKIEDLRSNLLSVERIIMELQIKYEGNLRAGDVVFLDRGLPDILTFLRYAGENPNTYLDRCFQYRYASVYVLDPFTIERDGIRIEGEELRIYLDTWLPRDYRVLGYDVVRIPVMPWLERLEFLLDDLKAKD